MVQGTDENGKPILLFFDMNYNKTKKIVIYRATSEKGTYSKIGEVTPAGDFNGYDFTDTTAKSGETYYYKVKVICTDGTAGNSAFTDPISYTVS